MKKLFVLLIPLFVACGNGKSNEQAAEDSLNEDLRAAELKAMEKERVTDSLLNVACGFEGATLVANRQHALNILKEEYPELSERWAQVQVTIDEGVPYE